MSVTGVSVCLPTRGVIFARTIQSLIDNGLTDLSKWHIVQGFPIPECFNEGIRRCLKDKPEHILMVEDDNELPPGTLQKMLDLNAIVATCNYPMVDGGKGCGTILEKHGKVWHCGTGCTLIKPSLFERMPEPWFENDKSFDARDWSVLDIPNKYGGQDIQFGWKLRNMGVEIKKVPNWQVGHLRSPNIVRIEKNAGYFEVNPIQPLDNP